MASTRLLAYDADDMRATLHVREWLTRAGTSVGAVPQGSGWWLAQSVGQEYDSRSKVQLRRRRDVRAWVAENADVVASVNYKTSAHKRHDVACADAQHDDWT